MSNSQYDAVRAASKAGNHALAKRLIAERRIGRELVKTILRRGYILRVHDGEEYSPFFTTQGNAFKWMFSTDEDVIHAYTKTNATPGSIARVAWFHLVYGNSGYDVISDHAANDIGNAIAADLQPLTDRMEKWLA